MRRPAFLVVIAALAVAGCGSAEEDDTPDACLSGATYYSAALVKAPGAVRLPGGTPISDCLVANQGTGDLTNVGADLVRVATQLNAKARRDPSGAPTVQLGYLVGAVTRGAAETHGIHTELQRRVEAAALYSPAGKPPPEPFDHTYEKGYAAGREDG
jgi:hypothetical protein